MSDSDAREKWFQIAIAAAGVVVTALLGFGQWQLAQQQNRLVDEQRRNEERRASEAAKADREKSIDNIEVQVMAIIAPYLAKIRGSDKESETSQRVVAAAAGYLTVKFNRTGLAQMCDQITRDTVGLRPEFKTQIGEATQPVSDEVPWFAVLASLPANDLPGAQRVANAMMTRSSQLGFTQSIAIYKTKISNNYAVVIGGQMSHSDALSTAAAARQKGLGSDAFAQPDRAWTLVGAAPFK